MNRINRFVMSASALLLFVAVFAHGNVILEDDFTNAAASHGRWMANLSTGMTVTVDGGSCVINNTTPYLGTYTHTFASKPSVFTLSFVLKTMSADGGAGVMFCRQGADFSGYFLTIQQGVIVVFKMTQSGINISMDNIKQFSSFDLKPSDNKLTVSKSGSTFHVFVNDVFAGEFTDASFASGDVSLVVRNGVTATFGSFHMTNQFTQGGARTSFVDNFDNSELRHWHRDLVAGTPNISVANGLLRVTTPAESFSWMYVDIPLTDFAVRTEVRHVSGSNANAYGIILVGPTPQGGGNVPMLHFAISGDRAAGFWRTGDTNQSWTLPNPAINGSAPAGMVLFDTLEVRKESGSSVYKFFVNGTLINEYPLAANFEIIGAGVFTYSGLELHYNMFSAQREDASFIARDTRPSQRTVQIKNPSPFSYDLRGRRQHNTTATIPGRQVRPTGVYVNENGREVLIRGRRPTK